MYGDGPFDGNSAGNLTAMSLYINATAETWDSAVGTWDSQTKRWDSVELLSLNKVVVYGDSIGSSQKRSSGLTSDGGVAIDAIWETKDFTASDFGIPDIDKIMRWKGIELWALGNYVDVSYSTDRGNSWRNVSIVSLSSFYPDDESPLSIYFDVVASSLRIRFSNSTVGETFTIKKYQIEASPRESRR